VATQGGLYCAGCSQDGDDFLVSYPAGTSRCPSCGGEDLRDSEPRERAMLARDRAAVEAAGIFIREGAMKPGYRGPETEEEFVAEVEAWPAPTGLSQPTVLESVVWGWSLAGHWYVRIKTGANGPHGDHVICTTKKQASEVAEALKALC
jgi:hypothetical protein